ncbi:SRPBCC family protein [Spongiactinospora sp. TRM90649]|uniref:SRPBCC family protein n=1 Tax=Spongiactinospora sp. TRM90649 TaxID=3031114 RepID=UPI0023F7FB4F|nr:SRPBCC family protein [Spongiactinospora sp. TRM90649]MDF5757392.1 SRPBCC family protein [Spongiactinospora sp. TRM90649]
MIDRSVTHATFTLERLYPATAARVFAAWADPKAKARWFSTPDADHELDFRVGGREVNRSHPDSGLSMTYESSYHDIVQDERIVYTSTLHVGDDLATASLTTVAFCPADGGTQLVLTEQGAFLDGREEPSWRKHGTGAWLDALGVELGAGGHE